MPQGIEKIFKAYDVRGIYPTEIQEEVTKQIGRAFVAYLNAKRIAVGRDMRLSSPSLSNAFIRGATFQGADVVDYGLMGTDSLYFAVAKDHLDGGAEITASHNPKDYNGIKLVQREARPLSGDVGLSDIRDMILDETIPDPAPRKGAYTKGKIKDRYLDHVLSFIDPSVIQPFHIVLDAGSGVASLMASPLFDRLPCRTTRLCFEIDGTFPNHEANPLIEKNRQDIVNHVISEGADIGIAWDGDADRCFFIDESGEFIAGDFITALLAEAFLLKEPNSTIIYDVRASYAVKDTAKKFKGKALMNRVGHAFFKKRMREVNAIFGGEVTGHYYFRNNFFADNGLIPALLILELMSKKQKTLRELLTPLRERYFISGEINTNVASMEDAALKIELLNERYTDASPYMMDGISVEYPDWHFNVRPSNTEPLLRLNLEGSTQEIMEQRRDEILEIIRT